MSAEKFAPRVLVRTAYGEHIEYTPAGWEWILAFALAGCDWAVKEASKPEFRGIIRAALEERDRMRLEAMIAELEAKLDALKIRRDAL